MTTTSSLAISVRPLRESELDIADRVCREAFNTFVGVPDLFGDLDYVHTRWGTAPDLAIAAEVNGALAGSNFITCWGSFGFFGPLSVRPELWDRGVARGLMETTMDLLESAGVSHAGLFTFGHSAKHLDLYERFGFWPRFLTPILSRNVTSVSGEHAAGWSRWSELSEAGRAEALAACREISGSLHDGLDLEREIQAVSTQSLGDTVFLEADRMIGFAVCHAGKRTEAGSGACYVKFGALRAGSSEADFDRLVYACDALAGTLGVSRLELGVNAARHEAYRRLMELGFRAGLIGVAMQRPNEPAWNRPGVYVVDDWR